MQLLLDTNGLQVKKRNNAFHIIGREAQRIISPQRITSIAVRADCLISSAAIRLASEHQIPIFFFDAAGKAEARLWSDNFTRMAEIRRQQVLFALKPEATDWVISLFGLKASQQIANLKKLRRRRPARRSYIDTCIQRLKAKTGALNRWSGKRLEDCRASLMGIEGIMARLYWEQIAHILPPSLQFEGRSRRPARDPFNAALNYLYGMMYRLTSSAVLAAGLDLQLGILHTDQLNKPTFTYDLIEPFRPWVDWLLLELCLNGELEEHFFDQKQHAFTLSKAGKGFLIPRFHAYMQSPQRFEHRQRSRQNHLYNFAGEFAERLLREAEKS